MSAERAMAGAPTSTTGAEITEKTTDPALAVLRDLFTYHAPTVGQPEKYGAIRDKALELATMVHELCPAGADRTTAVRLVREAVMWANSSIANSGASYR